MPFNARVNIKYALQMLPRSTLCLNEPYLTKNTSPVDNDKSGQPALRSGNGQSPSPATAQHKMATQITRCVLPLNDPSPEANQYRTALACPPDVLTLSGQKLKAALDCLKQTGLMRLLEPKKLLAASRPLSDLQRVNLVFFGCCLLGLQVILAPNEQDFVDHQKQLLDDLTGRIENGHPLCDEESTFLATLRQQEMWLQELLCSMEWVWMESQ